MRGGRKGGMQILLLQESMHLLDRGPTDGRGEFHHELIPKSDCASKSPCLAGPQGIVPFIQGDTSVTFQTSR